MSSSISDVSKAALNLPISERAALLDRIFDSIDLEVDKAKREATEKRWAEESEKRIDAFERGDLKAVNGPDTLAKLRGSLQK